jgi:predicted PurR-regulated permease PerM
MEKPINIVIAPSTIVTAILLVLLVALLFFLKDLVLIVLTAVVIASSIEPGVSALMRRGLSRTLSVLALYVGVLALIFGVAYAMLPPILDDLTGLLALLPQYLHALDVDSLLSDPAVSTAREAVAGDTSLITSVLELRNLFSSASEGAFRAVSGVFGGVVSFVLIVVLSFYFALRETGVDDFLRIVVPVKHTEYAVGLWKRSHRKIGLWMQGQLLLSLIAGVMAYLWLAILGVPYALLLAVFVAIAELIPVFGSFLSAVPAVALAATAGGLPLAFLVAGGFLVINQLQSNLIYPLVVEKVVGVPPLLVILALIAGAQLAGFLGILLSVPVAAAVQEFISDIEKQKERERLALKH